MLGDAGRSPVFSPAWAFSLSQDERPKQEGKYRRDESPKHQGHDKHGDRGEFLTEISLICY